VDASNSAPKPEAGRVEIEIDMKNLVPHGQAARGGVPRTGDAAQPCEVLEMIGPPASPAWGRRGLALWF
jgi:hypothetical protein